MRVAATRKIPKIAFDLLRNQGIQIIGGKNAAPPSYAQLKKLVRGADAIFSELTEKIDKEIITAAGPHLKIIASYAVGTDNIDVAYARKKGIFVTNTPGVPTEAVAEHAIALLFAVARRVVEADRFMRAGKYKYWNPELLVGTELHGKTFGIVGCGRIGAKTAEIAHAGLGMNIIYSDIAPNPLFEKSTRATHVSLNELLKTADVISLHAPLIKETRHLISASSLKIMKPSAILINTARGALIDEKALVAALKKKRILGAGLDVMEYEPKPTKGLTSLSNVILTPHIGSATHDARDAMARIAAENIIDALSGKIPKNQALYTFNKQSPRVH
ncbi:MAG: D-glycerate dehydrogenase [bacterium]|nr:D-glycerate dehydrogenase [bacterium]